MSRRRFLGTTCGAVAAVWVAWSAPVQADRPEGQILDRVVAVVDGTPLTLSELEFEARVALVQRGAVRAATEPLDPQTLASALDYAVAERLQAEEADKLQAWEVEAAEVETALRAFRERFFTDAEFDAFLLRHDADLQQLGRVLERGLRAARMLDAKVRLRAQVSEAEVRAWYDAHRSEMPGTFEEVRAPLKEKLVRDRSQKLVKAELEQLRRAHDVRRVAPFEAAPGAGEGRE